MIKTPPYISLLIKKLWLSITYIFPPFISLVIISYHFFDNNILTVKLVGFCAAAILISSFAYFLNDATDIKIDKLANKPNMASKMPIYARIIITIFLPIIGLVVFCSVVKSIVAMVVLLLEVLCLIGYSVKPFRGKESPIIGPLLDAHYGHILPIFITLFAFLNFDHISFNSALNLALVYILLLSKGCRNILLHQIQDRKTDRRSNIHTFPNSFGSVFTINLINFLFVPLELTLIAALTIKFYALFPIFLYSFLAFIAFYLINFSAWNFPYTLKRELFFKFWYFLNDYYEFWIPFICIWAIAIPNINKVILSTACIILFWRSSKKFMKELKVVFYNLMPFR